MHDLDTSALIEKHKGKGALIDTNLMVLLLVGLVNEQRIVTFKRTQNFSIKDFVLLQSLVDYLGTLVTTPHVLAQVSDLTDLPGKELSLIRTLFGVLVNRSDERHISGRDLVVDTVFSRHGLTDAAIAAICSGGVLVVTADLNLYLALQERGADAINFIHVRPLGWPSTLAS